MISHAHQCIFVHIPKTAGNSINRLFGVGWEDHKDLQRYFDEMPRELFLSYFKFAVVRNPWDRLFSDYNYQKKKSRAKDSKLFVFTERGQKRDFAAWAETALAHPDRYDASQWGGEVSPLIHRWSPQLDWIQVQGETRVDYVARLERLPEDFQVIRQRAGLPVARLPHRNRRLHWHYSHYYDRQTRELAAAYYARDIAFFGYEFEDAFFRISLSWPAAFSASANRHGDVRPDDVDGPKPDRARSIPVALAWSPPRSRHWHTSLAIAAGFALFLTAAATLFVDANVGSSSRPFELRSLIRSVAATSRTATARSVASVSRLTGLFSSMQVGWQPLPGAASSFVPLILFDDAPAALPATRTFAANYDHSPLAPAFGRLPGRRARR